MKIILTIFLVVSCLVTVFGQLQMLCKEGEMNVDGVCVTRESGQIYLEGCLQYDTPTSCAKCQQYYILQEDGSCTLQRIYYTRDIPLVNFGPVIKNLTDPIETQFGPSTRKAHQFNIQTYPELTQFNILGSTRIEAITGVIVTFFYENVSLGVLSTTKTDCDGITTSIYTQRSILPLKDPVEVIKQMREQIDPDQKLFDVQYLNDGFDTIYVYYRNSTGHLTSYQIGTTQRKQIPLTSYTQPLVIKKLLKTPNFPFDPSIPTSTTNYPQFGAAVFFYGDYSISVIFDICKFLVNELAQDYPGARIYNNYQTFFESFNKIKKNSLISNLPPIRNVEVQEFFNGEFYVVNYQVIDGELEEIPFTMKILNQNGQQPMVFDYQFNTDTIKQFIQQKKMEFQAPDPPPSETGINIQIQINAAPFRILGCQKISNDICIQCMDGYELINGNCKKCSQNQQYKNNSCIPYNCSTYKNHQCLTCQQNYQLLNNKECHECKSDQDYKNQKCVPKNCLHYQGQGQGQGQGGDICYECEAGYGLRDTKCQKCMENQEEVVNGVCGPVNCVEVQGGVCVRCRGQYGVREGRCWKCGNDQQVKNGVCAPLYCQNFQQQKCLKCQQGNYQLQNAKCLPCTQNQQLIDGICTDLPTTPQFCLLNNGNICLQCYPNFTLTPDSKRCILPNCTKINFGLCQQCQPNFILIRRECRPIIQGCLDYDFIGCLVCQDGYFLENQVCVRK